MIANNSIPNQQPVLDLIIFVAYHHIVNIISKCFNTNVRFVDNFIGKILKCYSWILWEESAENLRFWSLCIVVVVK